MIDIYTNVEGTDLGSVTKAMQKIVNEHKKELPRGSHFILRGQSQTMYSSYFGSSPASLLPSCSSTCSSLSIFSRGSIRS